MRVYLTVSGRMQQKYIYSSTVGYLTTNLRYLSLLAEVGSEEVKTLLLYFFRYRYSTGVCFFLTTFDFSLHLSTKICTFYSLGFSLHALCLDNLIFSVAVATESTFKFNSL